MKILNLGCGTKVSSSLEVINIDWSIYLRLKRNPMASSIAHHLVKGERLEHFNALSGNVMVHNLAKGLPFSTDSVDVVYHSHLLEHLDRHKAKEFLYEVKRVLKPGGIQRIVVPDLQKLCELYLSHISTCESAPEERANHDNYIAAMIEPSVRKESHGTSQQKPLRRFVENTLLGDARSRGETHQWMYDRINLSALLVSVGFNHPSVRNYVESAIPNWDEYGLDVTSSGDEYKPGSLYVEAVK